MTLETAEKSTHKKEVIGLKWERRKEDEQEIDYD